MYSIRVFTCINNEPENVQIFYSFDLKVIIMAGLCLELTIDSDTDILIGYESELFNIRELGYLVKKSFRS
jgi:hypothetical protein